MSKLKIALIVFGVAALIAAIVSLAPGIISRLNSGFEIGFRASFTKSATESCEKTTRDRLANDGRTIDGATEARIVTRCTCAAEYVAKNLTPDDMTLTGTVTPHVETLLQEARTLCAQ